MHFPMQGAGYNKIRD